jgi:hypothetical protein
LLPDAAFSFVADTAASIRLPPSEGSGSGPGVTNAITDSGTAGVITMATGQPRRDATVA